MDFLKKVVYDATLLIGTMVVGVFCLLVFLFTAVGWMGVIVALAFGNFFLALGLLGIWALCVSFTNNIWT